MIAKLFKRFSVFSLFLSLLILSFLSYLYSDLEMLWLSFQSRILNFLIILGLLIMTINSVRRIFKFSKFENRFSKVEDELKKRGKSFSESSFKEMDEIWNIIKKSP